jgi:hypothetical protein
MNKKQVVIVVVLVVALVVICILATPALIDSIRTIHAIPQH